MYKLKLQPSAAIRLCTNTAMQKGSPGPDPEKSVIDWCHFEEHSSNEAVSLLCLMLQSETKHSNIDIKTWIDSLISPSSIPLESVEYLENARRIELTVDGMSCAKKCLPQLEKALWEISGVESVQILLEEKLASIVLSGDTTATEVDLIRKIRACDTKYDAYVASKESTRRESSLEHARVVDLRVKGM